MVYLYLCVIFFCVSCFPFFPEDFLEVHLEGASDFWVESFFLVRVLGEGEARSVDFFDFEASVVVVSSLFEFLDFSLLFLLKILRLG